MRLKARFTTYIFVSFLGQPWISQPPMVQRCYQRYKLGFCRNEWETKCFSGKLSRSLKFYMLHLNMVKSYSHYIIMLHIYFQVTDPRVLEIYRKTSNRPAAQGIGEFLFSTGIIPSDTDFRIWRDFGNITGML